LAAELDSQRWEFDVADPSTMESVVAEVISHYVRLDGVVNCVGCEKHDTTLAHMRSLHQAEMK
jgi:NAD(P)-dependent dehydrogenase (short-subunit alcohol dehydrogenase family)